jgi:DNA-directed RNA polymerase II subunit RPB1
MEHKGLRMSMIDKKLTDTFADQISVMVSDDNSDKHVVRIRLNNIEDDEETTVASFLKNEFEPALLNDLALKGLPEISKVTFTKNQDSVIDSKTGSISNSEESWVIETDGSALAKILTIPKVDATRTVSNDTNEILKVLGVEAARQSLINEMRFVLSAYGIYVNYRHIATLVDVMTLRGRLTSITRSGINRVDSGVLRKCTFEETVEILMEGAVFSEKDPLSGISENIIVGQLGPFGTGSFGISLNPQVIEEHAKDSCGVFMEDDCGVVDDTPVYDQSFTPTQAMTPGSGMMTPMSHYPMTPSGALFSPKMDGQYGFDSPGYQSPSPAYGFNQTSPGYNQ